MQPSAHERRDTHLHRSMQRLDDDQLDRVLTIDAADYTEEAIAAAQTERQRRGPRLVALDALVPEEVDDPARLATVQRCHRCLRDTSGRFFRINDWPTCAACKEDFLAEPIGIGSRRFVVAAGLGLLVSGGLVLASYALFALTNTLYLASVTLGYPIASAVRYGARLHGGRTYQGLAMGLVLLHTVLAYGPFLVLEDGGPIAGVVALLLAVSLGNAWRLNADAVVAGPLYD